MIGAWDVITYNTGKSILEMVNEYRHNNISAVENAVASDLSKAFVEGTNSKVKMVKRTMYGR